MTLTQHMRSAFNAAKNRWRVVLASEVAVVVLSSLALQPHRQVVTVAIGVASFLCPLLAFALRDAATEHQRRGEQLRHLLLLRDALGRQLTDYELAQIHAEAGAVDLTAAEEPYYTSELPVGANRLAMQIQESAFFSARLAGPAAGLFLMGAGVGCLLCVLLLWTAVQMPASTTLADLAKYFPVIALFLTTGSMATFWRSYSQLASTAQRVTDACDRLRGVQGLEVYDVLMPLHEYDLAVVLAPPIPELLYKLRRRQLTEAWKQIAAKNKQAAGS